MPYNVGPDFWVADYSWFSTNLFRADHSSTFISNHNVTNPRRETEGPHQTLFQPLLLLLLFQPFLLLLPGLLFFVALDLSWLLDACRLFLIISILIVWFMVQPKFQNRSPTVVPVSPVGNLPASRRFCVSKRPRLRSYLTIRRLRCSSNPVPTKSFSYDSQTDCTELYHLVQHRLLHLPEWSYGPGFHCYCAIFSPLDDLQLLKPDFIKTTKVKDKCSDPTQAYVAAHSFLAPGGSLTSTPTNTPTVARPILPVIFDTGASLSITPMWQTLLHQSSPYLVNTSKASTVPIQLEELAPPDFTSVTPREKMLPLTPKPTLFQALMSVSSVPNPTSKNNWVVPILLPRILRCLLHQRETPTAFPTYEATTFR